MFKDCKVLKAFHSDMNYIVQVGAEDILFIKQSNILNNQTFLTSKHYKKSKQFFKILCTID